MTVKELIEFLKTVPEEIEVLTIDSGSLNDRYELRTVGTAFRDGELFVFID